MDRTSHDKSADAPRLTVTSRLAEVRMAYSRARQADIAEVMGVSQARVSQLERGDLIRTELGTLHSYIAALGGTLRLHAEFGRKRTELKLIDASSN